MWLPTRPRSPSRCMTVPATRRGWWGAMRGPTSRCSRSTPADRLPGSPSGMTGMRGSATGWSPSATPSASGHGHGRDPVRTGTRHPGRRLRRLPAGRRAHQPRELRRSVVRRPGPGHRGQRRDLFPGRGNVGIGFAVPASIAAPVVAELIDEGKVSRGWLGVSLQALTPEIAESLGMEKASGVLVADVAPDSPAARAGIRQADVVTAVGRTGDGRRQGAGPRDRGDGAR